VPTSRGGKGRGGVGQRRKWEEGGKGVKGRGGKETKEGAPMTLRHGPPMF